MASAASAGPQAAKEPQFNEMRNRVAQVALGAAAALVGVVALGLFGADLTLILKHTISVPFLALNVVFIGGGLLGAYRLMQLVEEKSDQRATALDPDGSIEVWYPKKAAWD